MLKIKKQLSILLVSAILLVSNFSTVAFATTDIGANISTNGNLFVDGNLKFTSGAILNYILQTDGSGNANWASISSLLGNASSDDLPEGATNKYYDDTKVDTRIDAQKGIANGLATLDGTGVLNSGQLPALAINNTYAVTNIVDRDALVVKTGDVAIVSNAGSGESRSYIWDGTFWIELLTPLNLYLSKANNLSDISNIATARTNLGLGTASSPTFNALHLSSLSSGSLLFSGTAGLVNQDNSNLFWDNINKRLGIKTDMPSYTLDVNGDIKTGDGSRLIVGSKTDPDPVGVNGAIYYNSTNNKLRCFEDGSWIDCIHTSTAESLSSLTSAIIAHSINNGDLAQFWKWSLTNNNKSGMEFGENIASTGTGTSILKASTLTGSTAVPLIIQNSGDGASFIVNDSTGDTTPFIITHNGQVGIGTNTFDPLNAEKLRVEAVPGSKNLIGAYGDNNSYLQFKVKNRNSGAAASSDIVAESDVGTENDGFMAMGIASSNFNDPTFANIGPSDTYLQASGNDFVINNLAIGKAIKFFTNGMALSDEKMRIEANGNIGIGTTSPGSKLDIKGTLRLSGSNSGFVGFAPANDAGSTTYTLPASDGSVGETLTTNGLGILSWANAAGVLQRIATTISPIMAGDDFTTSGNIYTTATGTISSAGLLSSTAGLTVSGGNTSINDNSNFDTKINTGSSTGAISVGNLLAGAINLISGADITLNGQTILLNANDTATGYVKIGDGIGTATPDIFTLSEKNTAGDPATGINGSMYYNSVVGNFRCYLNGTWNNCGGQFLDTILSATNTNTINNGDNAQVWNWSLSSNDKKAFTFGENLASTALGTSAILYATNLALSKAMPLFVENLGDGDSFRVNDSSGDTTPFLIDSSGNVAIGSNSFDLLHPEKLKVDSGNAHSYNIITATGNLNNYLQMNIKNRNSGNLASSDLVATADNGTEDINYIDMGINSSGYNNPDYSIGGPNDGYLVVAGDDLATPGGNLSIGTATEGKVIKFHTGGSEATNEKMRITDDGYVGIGTTTPSASLEISPSDAKALRIAPYGILSGEGGELQFMEVTGAGDNYAGFKAPDSLSANVIWTLPTSDGTAGYALSTDGLGNLSWANVVSPLQRILTTISPVNAGDNITTSGNISTTGTGILSSTGGLISSLGATITGASANINASSNFDTNINTGTSTGKVSIGNSLADTISLTTGQDLNLSSGTGFTITGGTASLIKTLAGAITLQPAGTATSSYVKIGEGGLGSTTPDLLALDVKSDVGDPAGLIDDGSMYYNKNTNKFRCHINGSWGDCDTTGGTATLQSAYNAGATITTASNTDIALTLSSGNFTASGAGAVNLTPTSASSFTSGGALTLTGGAASTWGTTSGDLTLQVAGTATTAAIKIGAGGAGSATPDLLGLDVKSTVGDPVGFNGAMYYNSNTNTFRCFEGGVWKDCGATGSGASTLQQAYLSGNQISTNGSDIDFVVNTTDAFRVSGAGSVNMTPTSASSFTSGGALTLIGGASSTWGTTSGNLNLQVAGAGATGNLQVGAGGAGSLTPDLLVLDKKTTLGDPVGTNGAMYYNAGSETMRCFENGTWKDCDDDVTASLQIAYDTGNTITTNGSPIAFTLTNGNFNVSGADAVNLTPTSASSFTSGGALTLTAGATSTWGTSTGNLHLQVAGPASSGNVQIGSGISSATPDKLVMDLGTSDPVGTNGAMYYNTTSNSFRCYENSAWGICNIRSIGTAKGDSIFFTGPNTPVRLPVGSNGQYIIADSTQAAGVRWTDLSIQNDSLDFAQFKNAMTVDANTSINLAGRNLTINDLTGAGAISMTTNGAPITLTADGSSTWKTSTGSLTLDSATTLNLGTSSSTAVSIGRSAGGAINLTSPSGINIQPHGVAAGNTGSQRFLELLANGINYVGFKAPDSITTNTIWTLPSSDGTNNQVLSTNGTGILSWLSIFVDPMTTRGDLVYRDSTNTTTRLGRGTTGQVLKSDGTDISWQTLSNTDVGLGNVTNDAQIAKSIGLAKGDLIVYSASNTPTRLPLGALNGYVLTQDNTTTAGVKWAAVSVPNDSIDFAQMSDTMTVDATTSINLDGKNLTINDTSVAGGGALSITTKTAPLTLTANGASTWKTTSGALTIDSAGNLNIGTTDASGITIGKDGTITSNIGPLLLGNAIAGELRISDGSSNFITITAPNISTNYTLTLPLTSGTADQHLATDGNGNMSWADSVNYWDRTLGVLSPLTPGDSITSSGNISTTGTGTITSAGLLTATSGVSIGSGQSYTGTGAVTLSSGAATALTINSGTTGTLSIGTDASTETINIATGAASKTLTIGSINATSPTTINSGTSGITLDPAGTTTAATVQIGVGGAGNTTPDLLALAVKSTSGDPAGQEGQMYYNTADNKFRCFQNTAWIDCIGSSAPSGVTDANYTFAYDTTTQTTTAATWKDITFDTNGQLDGWTHPAGTANFTCTQTGLYLINVTHGAYRTAQATPKLEFRSVLNEIEIPGTTVGVNIENNNLIRPVTSTFIVNATSGQILKFQMYGASNSGGIIPMTANATTNTSIQTTITRIK